MRAFVAVEITEPAIRSGIRSLQSELAPPEPGRVRMVDADILHFTLQFLGDVPDHRLADVTGALSSVRFEPFDLEVRGVGAFPSARRPRTVWVGGTVAGSTGGSVSGTDGKNCQDQLAELAQGVAGALCPLGYARDKPFRAHSTIFRVKDRDLDIAVGLDEVADRSFGIQRIDCIKLKSSVLTREGPVYSDVAVISAGEHRLA